jgi:hypothetical protein
MKTFKIEFQDIDNNELFSKTDEFVNLESAQAYAQLIIATSNINDLFTFQIFEL